MRNFRKKAFAVLLVCLMMISVFPVSAFAADELIISAEKVTALPGSEISVNINIANNPGISSLKLNVTFDNILTLNSVTYNNEMGGQTVTPQSLKSPVTLTWVSPFANYNSDGVFVTLNFTVSETATPGKSSEIVINYDPNDIYNMDETNVPCKTANGSVTLAAGVPGDINGDQVTNNKDITRMFQYLAGWNVYVNTPVLDTNGDGSVNNKDLTRLFQYLADWDVEIFPNVVQEPEKCNHNLESVQANEPTCEQVGNTAYWHCTLCDRYYSDVTAETETTLEKTIIAEVGHTPVVDPAVPATPETSGLTEGSHCSVCGKILVPQYTVDPIDGYSITYNISNGDSYLATQTIQNPNQELYPWYSSESETITLKNLKAPDGYIFLGWYDGAGSNAVQIKQIPKGTSGEVDLYAHWEKIVYDVIFDSPDIPWETVTYTVDKGTTLTKPSCFGYTFMGWSNDDGFIVDRIKPGTFGHLTLHANWTSDRNKATSYNSYVEPIIIEDNNNGQFLFVYNIGKIDNVPLDEVDFIGKTESLKYSQEITVTDYVDESYVNAINDMVSNATTKSSGWTLSKEWNDVYETSEEVGSLSEKSDERTTAQGTVVGGKYFVSNSQGGSSHVSNESGSSSSTTSKVAIDGSVGINSSYTNSTEKYSENTLGISDSVESKLQGKLKSPVADISAGLTATRTVDEEMKSGRRDSSSSTVGGELSFSAGTENGKDKSKTFTTTIDNSSTWNSSSGYEQSSETSRSEAVTSAIKEQISKTTSHNLSKALGGQDSKTEAIEDTSMSSREYSTTLTYAQGSSTETKKTFEFNSSEPGYYRIITAGTVHVYGVVGYDVATASYYTYCFNVLDDNTRQIMDYSKDNMLFNDCENGVVTFEIPYEVNEYIAGVTGKTAGLEISYDGMVTDFVPTEDFDGTIVVPQYVSVDNKDGTYSAIKVTSINSNAFASVKESLKTIVLPVYVTDIPDSAFEGFSKLEEVISFGATTIGAKAFKDCVSLKSFAVDNMITSLGDGAFLNVSEVSVVANNSAVADAATACGAKRLTLDLSRVVDSYENRVITMPSSIDYFALIGNGGTYNNIQVVSDAKETMISNMLFANNADTPIKLGSPKATLARVTVANSPGFALVMTAENVDLKLLGTVSLTSLGENTVISKNVTLGKANNSVTSILELTGKYLVCGQVTNTQYLNVEPTVITAEQFETYLTSSVISFDANGGSVSTTSKVVYYGQLYGELPIPTKSNYDFVGWFTAKEGGTKVTSDSAVSALANQVLYAQWSPKKYTVSFNANGGTVSESTRTVTFGTELGTLPTPKRDYYTFQGWYTEAVNGTKVNTSTNFTEAKNVTLYAHWTQNPVSDWVLASKMPSGAEIIDEKWTYTKTETTTSTSASLSGWTQTGSFWQQTATGTWYYGSYPSGFNTGNSLYSKYNKSALTAYTNDTTKREVSAASFHTYIYWHWHYDCGSVTANDRLISAQKGTGSNGMYYGLFAAFESSTNYGHTDSNGTTCSEYYCNRGNKTDTSWWWFRFNINKQTYTDYQKVYNYKKVTNHESETSVTASGNISNVNKMVKYRAK